MDKAKEISALWKQIKPQIGELARLCHEVEDHAEATADAYQRGYKEAYDTAYADAEEIYESGKRAMYQKGLKDAWEAARKICDMEWKKRGEVFGTYVYADIIVLPVSECIEKVRKYEQEKEDIQVGDEVEAAFGKATVTETTEKHVYYFYADGSYGFDEKEHVTKTGRHFPEIATVLEKMKENNDNK